MNIIYLHTHDTGRYIQPYGFKVDMPNLQNFAENGTIFRNNYCCAPTCSPSRSALLTGSYPHVNGMLGLAHRGFALKDYNQHLVRFLKKNGYTTALCGMQHEAKNPEDIGYDNLFIADKSKAENATDWDMQNADSAISFLRNNKDKKFFLSYGLEHTHRAFTEFDDDINPNYIQPPLPLYDNKENREDMVGFLTSARRADDCIGKVLDEIKALGLDKNSIIIYTTDHGIAFPKMKSNLYDAGISTSMILSYPNNKSKGKAIDALTSHIDVFPTLCDLTQIEKPNWLQGNSLFPILQEEQEEVNECVFAEVTFHASYEPQRAIRTKRYKYIKRFNNEHLGYAIANIDNSISKDFLMENDFDKLKLPQEQLYDLYFDPNEGNNLINNPEYQNVKEELSEKLMAFMVETNDPILQGEVELPSGGVVNKLDCYNPESKNPNDYERNEKEN